MPSYSAEFKEQVVRKMMPPHNETVALVREGLRALIERDSARRLARLGGSEPQLEQISRRRSDQA